MPEALTGEAVVVATATGPDAEFSIHVTDVSDDPECEEEPPGPTPPGDEDCLDLCDPTEYYLFYNQLPQPLQELLPPP